MNTDNPDLYINPLSTEDFNKMLYKRLDLIDSVLVQKAKEYVRSGDRLHNFHKASLTVGLTRERALDGFLLKHLISYRDFLDDLDKGVLHSEEAIREKFGDIINYFILQEIQFLQRVKG